MRFGLTISLILFFMMLLGSTCDNSEKITFCGVKDPLKNVEWIKKRVENAEKIEVTKIVYNGQDYLAINPCPNCPDNMTEIFDCEGNRFCTIGGITGRNTCPIDFLEKSEKTLVLKKGDQ